MTTNTSSALLALADDCEGYAKFCDVGNVRIAPNDWDGVDESVVRIEPRDTLMKAAKALRSAATAEPVAWEATDSLGFVLLYRSETAAQEHVDGCGGVYRPLYTSPPASGEPQPVVAGEREAIAEAIHRARFKTREPTPLGDDRTDREYAFRLADAVIAYLRTRQQGPDEAAIRAQVIDECPHCHNANSCGDYEGPTCELCGGIGFVRIDSRPPEDSKFKP